jgi:hypothetical protein
MIQIHFFVKNEKASEFIVLLNTAFDKPPLFWASHTPSKRFYVLMFDYKKSPLSILFRSYGLIGYDT